MKINEKKKISLERKINEKKELVFKEDGQEYAQILKMLGNGRCEAYCFDGTKRLCHIRGKLKKKIWINVGDIVLIGLRDFQKDKGDIISKYSPEESKYLRTYGEIPSETPIQGQLNLKD
nr:eukaryotic translation initiation factor 1A [Cryptomonas paramecium]